ncbi:MAG TPA: glycosyltransferase [Polyangiaceae bacterium]|nr:glycosyltransferase [Polyangiaceae bacterium]
MPRVSVVIPTYNVASFLAITLDSVLGQTLKDIEVILWDDGSRDATLEVAEAYAAKDPRVKVARGNHGGVSVARNGGFSLIHPSSEFVTFFDSDDVWEPDALESLVKALEAHPEAPAAHALCRAIDPQGVQFPHDDHAQRMRERLAVVGDEIVPIPPTAPTSFGALLIKNYVTTPGTSLMRRSALARVGLYDTSLPVCEDWDLNLRLARLGDFVFIDRILLSWRRHPGSVSNVSKNWRKSYVRARERSIHAPENSAAQKHAAVVALRHEVRGLQGEALKFLRAGAFGPAIKKLARSLALARVEWFGRGQTGPQATSFSRPVSDA